MNTNVSTPGTTRCSALTALAALQSQQALGGQRDDLAALTYRGLHVRDISRFASTIDNDKNFIVNLC